MPWPGAPLRICLLLWILCNVDPPWCRGEANVGCLFSDRLCLEEEWCYDDFAFGRCLPAAGDVNEDEFYRFQLEREDLRELSSELRRLFALGYRWSHGYTQCRLQAMLYAFGHDVDLELDSCSHLSDNDLEGALKALEGQVPLDPREVAIIRYTPSDENPHPDFADEIYYPPVQELEDKAREQLREQILGSDGTDVLDMEDPYAEYSVINKRSWIPKMHRRGFSSFFDDRYGFPKRSNYDDSSQDTLEFLNKYESGLADEEILRQNDPTLDDVYTTEKYLNNKQVSSKEIENFLSPETHKKIKLILKQFQKSELLPGEISISDMLAYPTIKPTINQREPEPGIQTTDDFPDERFTLTYNTPENFRAGWESRDNLAFPEELQDQRIYDETEGPEEESSEYGSGDPYFQYNIVHPVEPIFRERLRNSEFNTDEGFRELKQNQDLNDQFDGNWDKIEGRNGIYSEGGMVPQVIRGAMQDQKNNRLFKDDLDKFFNTYSSMGFKRPERLDVKKPGPPFVDKISSLSLKAQKDSDAEQDILLPSMMKKEPRGPNPVQESRNERNTDDQFVFVELKDGLKTWRKGHDIIMNISNLLHLEPSTFTDGQVFSKYVVFRVQNNSRGLNASDVARQIVVIRDNLYRLTGVEMISAGLGDGKRVQTVASTPIYAETQLYTVVFLVCGVLGGLIVAVALLIVIMKHIKSKEKLQALAKPDTEASKDYQDLCRARMAVKNQPTSETVHGRITSLSKESEQSPSSRSSTSSWSEEPTLHNMDISTGHMVLSYMEDHLKNKDRLEQEWVALCAYVAEPCEVTIALKKDNIEKNRYLEVVPYDHARVVLNDLCNASNSDYINASSITDHDPRNPAYIATQGPLPHTAADFWQLIWEQGAVVIVMLARLTESGAAMCHRYWPEEGSELYHIYEVHLVSEHIWCDDYLVRSFYLKNIKTGETRTVTQFHFLSWPDGGVPASTKALLEFRRKVNKSYRGRSCPIVVHCSDGAGRTGTYCLIDLVLGRMSKGAKEIDIAATLEHLRDQRPRMVATKQQFEFVLTAVAEEVHAILKVLPPQPTPTATTAPPPEKTEK